MFRTCKTCFSRCCLSRNFATPKRSSSSKSKSGSKGRSGSAGGPVKITVAADKSSSGRKDEGGEYPAQPSMYDIRKYGHKLPCHNVITPFDAIPCMPTGLFRCTYCEVLGPGADKCGPYPVPEYFAFHHMTYYDFHLVLGPFRMPNICTNRKP